MGAGYSRPVDDDLMLIASLSQGGSPLDRGYHTTARRAGIARRLVL
jgi:hypothetical protein